MVAVFVVVPALAQLRYGLVDVGHLEEWSTFRAFDLAGLQFWITEDSPISPSMIRPMQLAPASVAYIIDPDSFAGYHVLAALALALRALAMYLLVRALGSVRSVAAVAGLLFALFPAWQGALSTRLVHFNVTSAAITFAVWLLVRSVRQVRPLEVVAMGLLVGFGLTIYEAYYPIVFLVPLLLLVVGARGKQFLALAALWYIVPFLNGLRMVWVWRYGPPQYQESLVEGGGEAGLGDLVRLAGRVWSGAIRRIFDPWHGWSLAPLTLVIASIVVGAAVWLTRHGDDHDHDDRGPSHTRHRLIAAVVLYASFPFTAAVYAGFALHLHDPERVFYVVAFPGALLFAVLADLVRRPAVRAGVCAVVAAAVVVGGFAQRDHWHKVSSFQEQTLGVVAEAFGAHGAPSDLVLLDPTGYTGGIYTIHPGFFEIDLQYLFEDSTVAVTVCAIDAASRGSLAPEQPCWTDGVNVTLNYGRVVPAAGVLTLQISQEGVEYVDGPTGHAVELPDRVLDALDCVSQDTCSPLPSPDGLEAIGLE